MSRIGKKPISIPSGVTADVSGERLVVKGPKGEIELKFPQGIVVKAQGSEILVEVKEGLKKGTALWGLFRSLVANMVQGVTSGFEKKMEFEGIGFKAGVEGDNLVLQLGFSHPVKFPIPSGIKISVEKNIITVSGVKKELVGETAARLRELKPPEPYKGKGIRYRGEIIRRKAGKKAVASA